jgi:hypothetical protein
LSSLVLVRDGACLTGEPRLAQYADAVHRIKRLKQEEEAMLREVFDRLDADGGGTLDKKEVSERSAAKCSGCGVRKQG